MTRCTLLRLPSGFHLEVSTGTITTFQKGGWERIAEQIDCGGLARPTNSKSGIKYRLTP